MQALFLPALMSLLLLALALGWALWRAPRVVRRVPEARSTSRASERHVVFGDDVAAILERWARPGQPVLGVGVACGMDHRAVARVGDIEAWAERNEGGLVVLRSSALRGGCQGERVELHIAHLLDEVDTSFVVVADVDPDRLLDPDPVAAVLCARVDGIWLEADGQLLSPRVGTVRDLGRPTRAGARSRRWAGALATAVVLAGVAGFVTAKGWLSADPAILGETDASTPSAVWLAWWVGRWFDEGGPLFTTTHLFWPHGSTLVRHTGGLLPHLFSGLLVRSWGIPGWNTFVLLAMVSNGCGVAWLMRRLGARHAGALVAGAAFTVAPAVVAQAVSGRPELFLVGLLPVGLGLGLRALGTARPLDGWVAGVALLLVAWTGWLQGAVAVLVLAGLAVQRLIARPTQRAAIVEQCGRIGRLLVIASLATLPLVGQAARGELLGLSLELPHRLAATDRGALVVDELVRSSWRPELWSIALGLSVLVVAFVVLRRSRWLAAGAAALAVLAMGPWLPPISGVTGGWTNLPLATLWATIPGVSLLKRPEDLLVFVSLAVALILGLTLDRLRRDGVAVAAAPALVLGAAFMGTIPMSADTVEYSKIWRILDGEGAVAFVPLGWDGEHLYAVLEHGRPLMGGPSARASSEGGRLDRLMATDPAQSFLLDSRGTPPTEGALAELGAAGLSYIVLDFELIDLLMRADAPEAQDLSSLSFVLDDLLGPALIVDGGLRVYRVPSEP